MQADTKAYMSSSSSHSGGTPSVSLWGSRAVGAWLELDGAPGGFRWWRGPEADRAPLGSLVGDCGADPIPRSGWGWVGNTVQRDWCWSPRQHATCSS